MSLHSLWWKATGVATCGGEISPFSCGWMPCGQPRAHLLSRVCRELKHWPSDSQHSQPPLQEPTCLTCSAQHLGPPLTGLCFSSRPLRQFRCIPKDAIPWRHCMKEKSGKRNRPSVYWSAPEGLCLTLGLWLFGQREKFSAEEAVLQIHSLGRKWNRKVFPISRPYKDRSTVSLGSAPIWGAKHFKWDNVKKVGIWPKSSHSHPRTDSRAGVGGGGATSGWSRVMLPLLQGVSRAVWTSLGRLPGAEQGCRALQGAQRIVRCWGLAPGSVVVILCPVAIPCTFQPVPVPRGMPASWAPAPNTICSVSHLPHPQNETCGSVGYLLQINWYR